MLPTSRSQRLIPNLMGQRLSLSTVSHCHSTDADLPKWERQERDTRRVFSAPDKGVERAFEYGNMVR